VAVSAKQCAIVAREAQKQCAGVLAPVITSVAVSVANISPSAAVFLSGQKHAVIKPILKKPECQIRYVMLCIWTKSYWPGSNFNFISKFLEHLVVRRLLTHCDNHPLLLNYQSSSLNRDSSRQSGPDSWVASVDGNVCVWSYWTGAECSFGHKLITCWMSYAWPFEDLCTRPAHDWFGRSQTVAVGLHSQFSCADCGVDLLQLGRSVPGPVAFITLFQWLLGLMCRRHHRMTLRCWCPQSSLLSRQALLVLLHCRALKQCVRHVQVWCSSCWLQLGQPCQDPELIWFGSELNLGRISNSDVSVSRSVSVKQSFRRPIEYVPLASFLTVRYPFHASIHISPRSRQLVSFTFDDLAR